MVINLSKTRNAQFRSQTHHYHINKSVSVCFKQIIVSITFPMNIRNFLNDTACISATYFGST